MVERKRRWWKWGRDEEEKGMESIDYYFLFFVIKILTSVNFLFTGITTLSLHCMRNLLNCLHFLILNS